MTKYTYSHWDVMMADSENPLPKAKRDRQLDAMKQGLKNLMQSPEPTLRDWEVVSDAVNMMETLLLMKLVEDPQDAIGDAVAALAKSGTRHLMERPLRLDGPDIRLLQGVLEDYEIVLEALPERTMIVAHRATEKRTQEQIVKSLQRARKKEMA